jgi:simple sugar transport system substrate-binding protein
MKKLLLTFAATAAMAATASAANIAVVGGKADDLFWNKIKKGMDDACLAVTAKALTVWSFQTGFLKPRIRR